MKARLERKPIGLTYGYERKRRERQRWAIPDAGSERGRGNRTGGGARLGVAKAGQGLPVLLREVAPNVVERFRAGGSPPQAVPHRVGEGAGEESKKQRQRALAERGAQFEAQDGGERSHVSRASFRAALAANIVMAAAHAVSAARPGHARAQTSLSETDEGANVPSPAVILATSAL